MKKITILFSFIITLSLSCTNDSAKTLPQDTSITSPRKAIEISLKDIYNKPDLVIPTIASLKGEVIILDFWATWCSPCIAEFPKNNVLYNKYKDKGVNIIAITNDPKEKLENFLKNVDLDFWIARIEDKQTLKDYEIQSFPSIVIINKKGEIVHRGRRITEELIEEVLTTDTIALKKLTEPKMNNDSKLSGISFAGGFYPGEDPVYIDLIKNINANKTEASRKLVDKANIRSFVIRKSPYQKSNIAGYSSRNSSVGITIIGNELTNIFKIINNIPSEIRIQNKSKDTFAYDIIYSKNEKGNDVKKAFKEIHEELLSYLDIKFKNVENEHLVNKLTATLPNQYIITKDELEEGTSTLYTPIQRLLPLFENTSKEFFTSDIDLKDKLVYTYGIKLNEIKKVTDPIHEIKLLLQEKGIIITKEKEHIETFEIIDSQ
ncbi:TlpA family protein disulfide reductase [Aquimarina spinulae]|uniref:TlpA family protein disulfide reductase n=1 Tax=Aquimarina spinulae TaxID=1192023 RepID=UPI000D55610F|nr:TlpA disulfide reductase family protein [Aquimarina spinulae]